MRGAQAEPAAWRRPVGVLIADKPIPDYNSGRLREHAMERDVVAGLLLKLFGQEQGAVSLSKALAFVRAPSPEGPEDDETLLALIVDLA
jgi:hypothetical protein